MSWSAADIPDQTGRYAVVTGANGGLGLETTRELARKGATVVMAVRDQEKGEAALADLKAGLLDADLDMRLLDLGSLESVRTFANAVLDDYEKIDLLFNNAGVMGTPHLYTSDGFELQFGVNHLGHFALTALLMPALLRADAARVISTTSTGRHYQTKLDPDNLNLEGNYTPWGAYGRSKRANADFGLELQRRLTAAGSRMQSLIAHPGYSNTDLQQRSARSHRGRSQRFFATTVRWVGMEPGRGALPQLRAGTDPEASGGQLYTPRFVNNGPPVRRPITGWINKPEDGRVLWDVSERATGVDFNVAAMVKEYG